MNFALLGDDPAAAPLVRTIASHPEHRLSHVALAGPALAELIAGLPSVEVMNRWETLVADPAVDAVIVAGSDEAVCSAAKELAAEGRPLIVIPRVAQGSVFAYELSLMRDDSKVTLLPAFSMRLHPLVQRLQEMIRTNQLGSLQYLRMERNQDVDAQQDPSTGITRAAMEEALLSDVDLLRSLGGDYDQVTALRSEAADETVSLATVTLAGRSLPEATWTLTSSEPTSGWRVTARGDLRSAVLLGTDDPSAMALEILPGRDAEGAQIETIRGGLDPGLAVLEQFEAALDGTPVRPDWTDLTRAFEIVEACRRSLRSRRTIDLHFETTSERMLFKSQMSAIGCSLLILTFFASLGFLIVASLFDMPPQLLRILRIVIFVPIGVFLILQLFLFLAKPASSDSSASKA